MHQFSGAWPGDDSTQIERKHLGRGRGGGGSGGGGGGSIINMGDNSVRNVTRLETLLSFHR